MKKLTFILVFLFLMFSSAQAQDDTKKSANKKYPAKNVAKNSTGVSSGKGKSVSIPKPVEPVASTSMKSTKIIKTDKR